MAFMQRLIGTRVAHYTLLERANKLLGGDDFRAVGCYYRLKDNVYFNGT